MTAFLFGFPWKVTYDGNTLKDLYLSIGILIGALGVPIGMITFGLMDGDDDDGVASRAGFIVFGGLVGAVGGSFAIIAWGPALVIGLLWGAIAGPMKLLDVRRARRLARRPQLWSPEKLRKVEDELDMLERVELTPSVDGSFVTGNKAFAREPASPLRTPPSSTL